jgi:formyl-CoA transferase
MIRHVPVDTGGVEPKQVGFSGTVPVVGGTSLPIRSVGSDLGEHTTRSALDPYGKHA